MEHELHVEVFMEKKTIGIIRKPRQLLLSCDLLSWLLQMSETKSELHFRFTDGTAGGVFHSTDLVSTACFACTSKTSQMSTSEVSDLTN